MLKASVYNRGKIPNKLNRNHGQNKHSLCCGGWLALILKLLISGNFIYMRFLKNNFEKSDISNSYSSADNS